MNHFARILPVLITLSLLISSCGQNPIPPVTSQIPTVAQNPSTATPTTSLSPTNTPQGKTILITSAADSGPGTLRQAILDVNAGDSITFEEAVFPQDNPTTIYPLSVLPPFQTGGVTLDARGAGVIIDGSQMPDGWDSAIQLLSNNNAVYGSQITGFTGAAIQVSIGDNNIIQENVIGGSDYSIGLWVESAGNQISNNLLGVMADGITPNGNKTAGIIIMEGAHDNQIGPDNQISFNNQFGVLVIGLNTTGNSIFRNRIFSNGDNGIGLSMGGNADQFAPLLLDFDLSAGTLSGLACPYCEVIVYSGEAAGEGRILEGKTTTDESGGFSFEKGSSFKGPMVTATSTDSKGNTSAFSQPTSSGSHAGQFQTGNNSPRTIMVTKPTDELEDNRINSIFTSFWQPMDFQVVIDNEIVPLGLKTIRMTINEGEYFTNTENGVSIDWSKPELSLLPEMDNYITELVSHKIAVQYKLIFWDKANHPNGWEIQTRFKTEEEISRYLEYVRFIVTNFKGRVQYYELWNEPDINVPLQRIDPEDYINLAKRAIPLIREIDPEAKVIVGSTSGLAHKEARDYLFKILNSEIMPLADAVDWHPLYGVAPGSGKDPNYYANYPALMDEIIQTARRNGFKGEFFATEITYSGPGCGGCDVNDPIYSDIVSAKYTARGFILHLGNGVGTGAGGVSSLRPSHNKAIRYIANIFAGANADGFPVRLNSDALNTKLFTFAKSDGSKLVSLWTDGAAVDEDPGVESTITLPELAGWNATGIDILTGVEQPLLTEVDGGNLIIPGFYIRDYPLVIMLTK